MDVREKLMEIVKEAGYECERFGDLWDMRENAEEISDFMIANGVTVQEWISVDDRLPDVGNIVLIYSETDGVCLDSYSDDTFDYFDVTHWMPMPQPPKGE